MYLYDFAIKLCLFQAANVVLSYQQRGTHHQKINTSQKHVEEGKKHGLIEEQRKRKQGDGLLCACSDVLTWRDHS